MAAAMTESARQVPPPSLEPPLRQQQAAASSVSGARPSPLDTTNHHHLLHPHHNGTAHRSRSMTVAAMGSPHSPTSPTDPSRNPHAPLVPSGLHTIVQDETDPYTNSSPIRASPVLNDAALSSGQVSPSSREPLRGANGLSMASYQFGQSLPFPSRRMSIDRRVRSEALPVPRRHMSITSGKRPSVVTGGYESSTDDEAGGAAGPSSEAGPSSSKRTRTHSGASRASLAPPPSSAAQHLQGHANGAHLSGRRRAQSLMLPSFGADYSPQSTGSRRVSRLRPPSTGSPLSNRGTNSPRFGYEATGGVGLLRTASDAAAAQSRSASMRSVREETDGGASLSKGTRESSKRKAKLRDAQRHRNPFAASLGLGPPSREAVLSPDQIQDLLSDADLSSAIHLMNQPPPLHRLSVISPDPSNTPPTQASASPNPDSSVGSSPVYSRPFLVTAPPALTSGDWPGRPRTASVSSSIATPMRNVTPATRGGRRRTSSMVTFNDSDGGHIPFTHHVVVQPMGLTPEMSELAEHMEPPEEAISDASGPDSPVAMRNGSSVSRDMGTVNGQSPVSPIASLGPPPPSTPDARKEEFAKRRISGLFKLGKRREVPTVQPPQSPNPKRAPAESVTTPAKAQREAVTPAKQNRDAEYKRAEIERREEELAQDRQYRALMLIHAHPASQRRAQHAATHLDGYYAAIHDGLENPPKFNPLAILRWVKRTNEQKEAKTKWESMHGMRASSPLPPVDQHVAAANWRYTLEDVAAYSASGGKINFFIPPNVPEQPSLERQRSPFGATSTAGSLWSVGDRRSRPSISSSKNDKDNAVVTTQGITSNSVGSLVTSLGPVEQQSLDDGGMSTLSRSTSVETSHLRGNRGHRPAASTSGLPPTKPLSALRAPFEKLGSVARRNINLSGTHHLMEEDSKTTWAHSENASPHTPYNHPTSIKDSGSTIGTGTAPTPAPAQTRDVRGSGGHKRRAMITHRFSGVGGGDTGTSDDDHMHYIPRIPRLLRHPRSTLDRLSSSRRFVSARDVLPDKTEDGEHKVSRAIELRNLEEALAHERLMRASQAKRTHRSELEVQAEARIHEVEGEIYAERVELLDQVRKKLESTETSGKQMEYSVTHYLTQLDQVKTMFRTAADVDVEFSNLDTLDVGRKPVREDNDESVDALTPLRAESDRGFSTNGNHSDRGTRRRPARKQTTLPPPIPLPTFAYGLQAWPRRSIVDPTLGVPVDPLRRVELACQRARDSQRDMVAAREDATQNLQLMVGTVNQYIRQKDIVREWTKRTLDHIRSLKDDRNSLVTKIKGGMKPRMSRVTDILADLLARWAMSMLSYGIRIGRGVSWVRRVDAGWLAWALLAAVVAMLVFFYVVGDRSEVVAAVGGVAGESV